MKTTLKAILDTKGHEVHHVSPSASVREAVNKMNEQRIGSLLVIENEKVVGIFTERDVLTRVLGSTQDPAATPVSEVMTRKPISVAPTVTVEEAMGIVTEKRCRHLPVEEEGRIIGLVSIGDLTRRVTHLQKEEIEHLTKYITGQYPG